jgi:GDP/UDP-N,N'-diacetylbacillosamine 2-epimerase (hydrolysing)
MKGIRQSSSLSLQLIVTGSHLSPEFGHTVDELKNDGFVPDRCVEMLLSSDTPVGVTKSMGLGMIGMADALAELKPDLVVVLGDRFEIFAAAAAALVARIPIAHIHGGEITEGAIDEAFRHSITKMSHLHFVATEEYRRRVIQLGERPDRVYNVGGLGVDVIKNMRWLDRPTLEKELEWEFAPRNLMVTFHPVTLDKQSSKVQMKELLMALETLQDTGLLFTMPNADTDGRVLFSMIREFCLSHPHAKAFTSLGQRRYLSCLNIVDGVIGNSSSGMLEAPTLKKGTVNIGDRQKGRAKAVSVIDCDPRSESIISALRELYSEDFQQKLKGVTSPYGEGGASTLIVEILEQLDVSSLGRKKFHDLTLRHD